MSIFNRSKEAKTENQASEVLTKKCKYCKEEILKDAKVCKHCGKKQPLQISAKTAAIVGGIILIFIIIGSFSGGTSDNQSVSSDPAPVQHNREIESIAFAEHIIEGVLKSPSTAKFSDVKAYELSDKKDVWAVNGYVDSQNSFGAMIRSQWEVQLDYRDGKGGSVLSVLFDGKKIQ